MEDCTRENFKKMKDEIDELRKKELDRAKEFAEQKKKIEEHSQYTSSKDAEPEYALQFTKDSYLSKGFIESAKWIKEVVAKNMTEKMNSMKIKRGLKCFDCQKTHPPTLESELALDTTEEKSATLANGRINLTSKVRAETALKEIRIWHTG